MSPERLSLARIKIKFPDDLWISDVFKSFPDIFKMKIIYFLPYDLENSVGNALIEIHYYKIDDLLQKIKGHPSVLELNVLEKEDNKIKFNVKTMDPYLLYAAVKCGVLINFPINVRDGYAYWKLISSRKSIDLLLTLFEEKQISFELLKIGLSPAIIDSKEDKLSFEEEEVLNKAIKLGFFEIPRKISLEDLATSLGKSKSTISVMLRKIIRKKVLIED